MQPSPSTRPRLHGPSFSSYVPRRSCLALVLAPLLALPATCAPGPDSGLERARKAGLRVGYAVEPPWAHVDSLGHAAGESPEVLRAVAAMRGIDSIRWTPFEFAELIPALRAGRIDAVAAGLFVTEERARLVRFTRPTLCVRPALVVSDRGAGVDVCDGCAVAFLEGSVELAAATSGGRVATRGGAEAVHGEAEATRGGPEAVGGEAAATSGAPEAAPGGAEDGPPGVVVVPDVATGIAALRREEVAAVAISRPTARRIAERDPALRMREMPEAWPAAEAGGCAAFAFRLEEAGLARAVDDALASFLGTPEHLEMIAPFGFGPEDLAPAGVEAP